MSTVDRHNNLNRRCTVPGDLRPRQWLIVPALIVAALDDGRYALVGPDGQQRTEHITVLHNPY